MKRPPEARHKRAENKWSCPVQTLTAPNGTKANNCDDIRTIWHDHSSAIEAAADLTLEQDLASVREVQDQIRGEFELGPRFAPTLPELEQYFRDAKANRSTGTDGIPDEVFAIFARPLSLVYGLLFLKAFLRFYAPIQFVGGIRHEFSKGSGTAEYVDDWRSM